MSKMAELAMEIEDLYLQGYNEFTIATMLNIPVELVDGFVESFMDGRDPDGTTAPFDHPPDSSLVASLAGSSDGCTANGVLDRTQSHWVDLMYEAQAKR